MVDGYLIALIVQGVLLICLALVVLAHSRLLGLLHMRLGPAGARPLADGPTIGTSIDKLQGKRLDEAAWTLDFPRTGDTIFVFISPQCETCNALIPHVRDYLRMRDALPLYLVSTLDYFPMNRAYVAYRGIGDLPYVLGEVMAGDLSIEATPYALRIDAMGIVRAKGIVNNYENLVIFARQQYTVGPTGQPTSTAAPEHRRVP